MNKIQAVMITVGLLTFLLRLSFILLLEAWRPPSIINRGLRYVPVAVLTAIFIPEILQFEGRLAFTPENPRLLAGLAAILIAWKTKSALWTISAGMLIFLLTRWLL